jgi:hypothetical protein
MGKKSTRQDFNEAACIFYAGAASMSETYSSKGIAVYAELVEHWMGLLFQYRQKLSGFNANLEENTQYFGVLSTGLAIEMLDHEYGVLSAVDVQSEIIDDILRSFVQMDKKFRDIAIDAPLPFDRAGQGVLRDLTEVSAGLLEKMRLLKTLSLCLIYEADDFRDWQCEVLMRDADESYGKYETPWEETAMKDVMERRQQYINDMSAQHANIQMLHEEIVDDLNAVCGCSGKMAGEAERMSQYYLNRAFPDAAPSP